jgi:hypothetical protein
MEIKILNELPPNYEALRAKFGVDWNKGLVVTYYPNIHCKTQIPPDLVAHEEMHLHQQKEMGVEAWWEKFMADPVFRLKEETSAYLYQAKFLKKNLPRKYYRLRIRQIVKDMHKMYGGMCTKQQAREILHD